MLSANRLFLIAGLLISIVFAGCQNSTPTTAAPPSQGFLVTPLTANESTYGAAHVDSNLQDAWGLAVGLGGGFWIADRASGGTSLYDSNGIPAGVFYRVNGPGRTKGSPTGIVANTLGSFPVGILGASTFIFSSLNGTISALPSFIGTSDSTRIVLDRSSSSSYTGLALASTSTGPRLYAPNIKNQSLDPIDQNFAPLPQIIDRNFAQGYTPFNAVVIDTQLFVTHAFKSANFVQVGVAGAGLGSVDIYDLNGNYEKTLIPTGAQLNSPWGLAIAPTTFGSFSGKLLVGNFGDGKINVFDRSTGSFIGTLNDASGNPIVIQGLWALLVYNNTLYYTAGPNNGADGVFGKITLR